MFKLTDAHRALIRERKAAGLSLRAIAQWLEVKEGVKVSPQAVKDALDREPAAPSPRRRPPSESASATGTPENVGTDSAKSTGERVEIDDSLEGDAADYALISKIIADLDADIENARHEGNTQGQATLERLRLDALKRRRELRPPAPPGELDPELVDAGRKAADKLAKLVSIECEALGKADAPRLSERGGLSEAQRLAAGLAEAAGGDVALALEALTRALAGLSVVSLAALWYQWSFWARPEQLTPPGQWDTWLLCTGIGFGKTRTGAEWIRAEVEAGRATRMAFVGSTAADVRDVMVEGESGILAVSPPACLSGIKVTHEPSKRRITWERGGVEIATATLFSAEEPDRLRGPNVARAWCDELAAWEKLVESWRNLEGRMRLGPHPQVCATTTPRPLALIRELAADPETVVVRGSTRANSANLPERYKRTLKKYDGTQHGRQEIEGEILDDRTGAVFSGAWIQRVKVAPELVRVAVGVDPSTKEKITNDETGIIAGGVDAKGDVYLIADASGRFSPEVGSERMIKAFDDLLADFVVVETNRGGDYIKSMIRATLRANGRGALEVPVQEVHASRGKVTRAEPVAALYEQRRVYHVGSPEVWAKLEKEMIDWDPTRAASPNRIDAMVWLVTFLAVNEAGEMSSEGIAGPGPRLDPLAENSRGERVAATVAPDAVDGGWTDDLGGRFL